MTYTTHKIKQSQKYIIGTETENVTLRGVYPLCKNVTLIKNNSVR